MQVVVILFIPAFLAVLSLLVKKNRMLGILNVIGYCGVLAASISLGIKLLAVKNQSLFNNYIYVDSLSGFFIFLTALTNVTAALYSIAYIHHEVGIKVITEKKAGLYYALFNLFSFFMFCVMLSNNLGIVWVAVEMTTLVSAFLVGFYNNKNSIEASWKYIIICSVGISLALFGLILLYYNSYAHGKMQSINWTDIYSIAQSLDPRMIKAAFLFILVGYGTKAGFVPMHTWLPDAHSQSPAPISALLSGVLLKTAMYAIFRIAMIVNKSVGSLYTQHLFILFGLLSLGVSTAFVLVQKDMKRLLAYSSVEHMGIIITGIGFGGPIGLYGALLHVFNHAMIKSYMFFGAGNIVKKYKTNDMHSITGVIGTMPFTGVMMTLGVFALAGSPPFSIFISELTIVFAGFRNGSYTAVILFLFFIIVIFGALIHNFGHVLFGQKPADMKKEREPVSGKIVFIIIALIICWMGIKIPGIINKFILAAVEILRGGI